MSWDRGLSSRGKALKPYDSNSCLTARLVQRTTFVVCALALVGCVIPPPLEEAPPPANLPPVMVRDDPENPILPPPGRISQSPGSDLVLDNIPVTDPNVNDKLTLRLLLDGLQVVTVDAPRTGIALRVFKNVVVDLPCTLIPSLAAGQLVGVVSDRGFTGAGRETPSGAGTASVEWVIDCVQLDGGS